MRNYSALCPNPFPSLSPVAPAPAIAEEAYPQRNTKPRTDWKRRMFCPLFLMGTFFACGAITAHSQIIGQLEVNVPFAFHAGSSKFPAGKYIISMADSSNLTNMEIKSADGHTSGLFEVREAQAQQSPQKTELIFNHYGNRYFLAKIFDEGEKVGSAVVDSGYAKKYAAGGASGEETHLAASHAVS